MLAALDDEAQGLQAAVTAGIAEMLLQSHREFEIVTPRTLPGFRGEVLVLPDARCLSEKEMQLLEKFAGQGKALILTG